MIELTKSNLVLYTLGGFEEQDRRNIETALETDSAAKAIVEEARQFNLEHLGKVQLSPADYRRSVREERFSLYVQGKLDLDEARQITELLATDPEARAFVAEARRRFENWKQREERLGRWIDDGCPPMDESGRPLVDPKRYKARIIDNAVQKALTSAFARTSSRNVSNDDTERP